MSPDLDYRHTLRDDLMAAFSMALVTIPLALGMALAANAPIMSAIWSSIIGGVVATPLRSSHLSVNGAATGLIVTVYAGVQTFGNGDLLLGFQTVLAATICAGILIILAGILKLGKLADTFPTAVVQGLLAAIGLMILGRQFNIMIGASIEGDTAFQVLMNMLPSIANLNPLIALIGLLSLAMLIYHQKIFIKALQHIPATVLVLIFAIASVSIFNLLTDYSYSIFGSSFNISKEEHTVTLPNTIWDLNIVQPNFEHIFTIEFWILSVSIAMLIFIETLMSGKISDSIDPQKRHTNLNRELIAVGSANIVAGFLMAMPIISAIPLYTGAKTKMANFYHGIILLFLLAIFAIFSIALPLASLAALLVYTGYKFAAPKIIKDTYRKGDDQLLVFLATLLTAINFGLLQSLVVGLVVALLIYQAKSNITPANFFKLKALFTVDVSIKRREKTGELSIRSYGILTFLNILDLKSILRDASHESHIILDLSHTRLIDFTVLQYLGEEAEILDLSNTQFDIIGLDTHATAARHPYAMRVLPEDQKPVLSKRQQSLKTLTENYEGEYFPEIRWDVTQLRDFKFFKSRKIEYKLNTSKGLYGMFFEWESCDIAFAEGNLFAGNHEKHTSIIQLELPFNAPIFILERENIIDKLTLNQDIDFQEYSNFSDKFLLQGVNYESLEEFFSPELIKFLENNEGYHIESSGSKLLIFKQLSFANASDMEQMHKFAAQLSTILVGFLKKQALSLKL